MILMRKDSDGTRTYIVHVQTGDRFGAGTDARVFLEFYGECGSTSGTLRLRAHKEDEMSQNIENDHKNKFERGHLDRFVLRNVPDCGKLEKIRVWHDNSGLAPPWLLEYVEISEPNSRLTYRFPCHKWLRAATKDNADSSEVILRCMETRPGPGSVIQPAMGVLKSMDAAVHEAVRAVSRRETMSNAVYRVERLR